LEVRPINIAFGERTTRVVRVGKHSLPAQTRNTSRRSPTARRVSIRQIPSPVAIWATYAAPNDIVPNSGMGNTRSAQHNSNNQQDRLTIHCVHLTR
jgi:hypothetical protein